MRKSRFTDEQVVAIIRQAVRGPKHRGRAPAAAAGDGECPAEEAGGGARPGDRGDTRGGGKKLVSVPARRRQVAYGREHGLSARRACTLFSVARSALGYRSVKPAIDAKAMERMKALSAQYPRYGSRRVRIFLARDGHPMSPGGRIGCGGWAACRCRASGAASGWPRRVRARRRRPVRTRCGATTSCSTAAPTASS